MENRLTSLRIFDETGYNMTSACKEAILNVDTEAGISVDDANRIFAEVGHCLSQTTRDAIAAAARKKDDGYPEIPSKPEPEEAEAERIQEVEIQEEAEGGETDIPETVDDQE